MYINQTMITIKQLFLPSLRSSKHSNVISNWNGLKYGDGLSSTVTLQIFTLAIDFTNFAYFPIKYQQQFNSVATHELLDCIQNVNLTQK